MSSLKRKRDASTKEQSTSTDYLDVFRRNFEAQFGVVKGLKKVGSDVTNKVVASAKTSKAKQSSKTVESTKDEDAWNELSDDDYGEKND